MYSGRYLLAYSTWFRLLVVLNIWMVENVVNIEIYVGRETYKLFSPSAQIKMNKRKHFTERNNYAQPFCLHIRESIGCVVI